MKRDVLVKVETGRDWVERLETKEEEKRPIQI